MRIPYAACALTPIFRRALHAAVPLQLEPIADGGDEEGALTDEHAAVAAALDAAEQGRATGSGSDSYGTPGGTGTGGDGGVNQLAGPQRGATGGGELEVQRRAATAPTATGADGFLPR